MSCKRPSTRARKPAPRRWPRRSRELEEARETLKRLRRDRETLCRSRENTSTSDGAKSTGPRTQRPHVPPRANCNRRRRRREENRSAAGDRVRVIPLDQEGEVIAVDGGVADVMLGALKTRQPVGALRATGTGARRTAPRPIVMPAARGPVNLELDLRGYRAAEIEAMLDEYLEHAYRAGMPFVRIIHGKGTGALRKVVRTSCPRIPAVASHEIAPAEPGRRRRDSRAAARRLSSGLPAFGCSDRCIRTRRLLFARALWHPVKAIDLVGIGRLPREDAA